jgi:hypothetical protein
MSQSTWCRTKRSIGAVALAALVLPAGCVTNQHHGIRPLRPLEVATAPYEGTITASLTGSLAYEGACLLLRVDGGGAAVLPVWPDGSVFNGTSVIFHEPGKASQPIMVDQQVLLEGRPTGWGLLQGYAAFQRQCRAAPFLVSKVHPAD